MYRNNLFYSHEDISRKSLGNDQVLQREIKLAKNIQTTLLNGNTPEFEGGCVTGASLPARLIGGDYYDFYPLVNGKIRIVIGDVMGKGIPAAMLMILTRGAFRSAAESTQSPGATLYAMNQALFSDLRKLRSFVTLFCADWDPDTGVLNYANAGHNIPLMADGETGHVRALEKVPGVMVGGLNNQQYREGTVTLKQNDTVFFYTDGIVEAQNKNGEQYRLERLVESLKTFQGQSIFELQEEIMKSIETFTEGEPQKDDITMVILKVGADHSDISSFNSPVGTS